MMDHAPLLTCSTRIPFGYQHLNHIRTLILAMGEWPLGCRWLRPTSGCSSRRQGVKSPRQTTYHRSKSYPRQPRNHPKIVVLVGLGPYTPIHRWRNWLLARVIGGSSGWHVRCAPLTGSRLSLIYVKRSSTCGAYNGRIFLFLTAVRTDILSFLFSLEPRTRMRVKSSPCRVSWRNHGPGTGLLGWSWQPECWSYSWLPATCFYF